MGRFSIATVVSKSGIGLHSGQMCTAILKPSAGGGWRLNGASMNETSIASGELATSLRIDDSQISTVEHLFAALFAHEIDDVDIEIEGPEVPILDGSAQEWYASIIPILQAGDALTCQPTETIEISVEDAYLRLKPADRFSAKVTVQFEGYTTECFEGGLSDFPLAMAARTFGYTDQLNTLQARGLALGASVNNVLGLARNGCSQLEQPAKTPNELAKHKWVDLLGDLALIGRRLRCHIEAVKSGHRMHHELVRTLRELSL